MIRIKQESEIHINDDYGNGGGHRSASTQSASSGDDDDDDECVSIIDCQMVNGGGGDGGGVGGGSGGGDGGNDSHSQRIKTEPEYYFDEESGQIIHFMPDTATANCSSRSCSSNDSHIADPAAETFTIRFLGDTAADNSTITTTTTTATTNSATLPAATNGRVPLAAYTNGVGVSAAAAATSTADTTFIPPSSAIRVKIYRCGRCSLHFERSYQLKRHSFVAHGGPVAGSKTNGTNGTVALPTSNGTSAAVVPSPLAVRASRPTIVAEMVTITHRQPAVAQYRRSVAAVEPQSPVSSTTTASNCAPIAAINLRPPASLAPSPPPPPPPPAATNPRRIRITSSTQHDAQHIGFCPVTGLFRCKLCGQTAAKLADIDWHLQLHNGSQYPYRCELCDERIASLLLLKNHVHAHTCIGWPHRCRRCELRFERRAHIVGHDCAGRLLANCVRCRLMFAAWPLKVAHERFVHGGRMEFGCGARGCAAQFIHRAALGVHRQVECAQAGAAMGGGGEAGGGVGQGAAAGDGGMSGRQ